MGGARVLSHPDLTCRESGGCHLEARELRQVTSRSEPQCTGVRKRQQLLLAQAVVRIKIHQPGWVTAPRPGPGDLTFG